MNERQHIALTEAQIIAAEKGEIQLEYRNGEEVCQLLWYKPPYRQYRNCVRTIHPDGEVHNHYKTGVGFQNSDYDLFISKPDVDFSEPAEQSQKPLYEVGEIIQVSDSINFDSFVDNAFFAFFGGYVLTKRDTDKTPSCWLYHRKKQKTVTLDEKVMTVKEAIEHLTNL